MMLVIAAINSLKPLLSGQRRDYESVDKKSLSQAMLRNSGSKRLEKIIQGVKGTIKRKIYKSV